MLSGLGRQSSPIVAGDTLGSIAPAGLRVKGAGFQVVDQFESGVSTGL
jgi:hypothetical protein